MNLRAIPDPVWWMAGLAIAGFVAYRLAKTYAPQAAEAVDPTSANNLAYRGANAVGAAVTQQDDFSLGTWFYDITHPNEYGEGEPEPAPVRTRERAPSGGGGGGW